MSRRGGQGRTDAGMVSAELAVSLVTLLLVLGLVLGAVRAGLDRAAAVSVAGALAREAARDGNTTAAWERLSAGLPSGSTLTLTRGGGLVTATVTLPIRGGLAVVMLPDRAEVSAVAREESR